MPEKKEIENSVHILSGLLGYSERIGHVSDINANSYCKKESECPERNMRMLYEAALRTAISVLSRYLVEN